MTASAAPPHPTSLEAYAQQRPEAIALCERDRKLSWQAWNDAADRLAEAVATRTTLTAGDRIAVCARNRLEWFLAQAAAAKLGALLVPISHRLTPTEVQYIVGDSGAKVLLVDAEEPSTLACAWTGPTGGSGDAAGISSAVELVLSVHPSQRDDVVTLASITDAGPLVRRIARKAPQSIVYTSGTTGRPRGVVQGKIKAAGGRPKGARGGSDGAPATPPPARPESQGPQAKFLTRNLLGAPLVHAAGQASARTTHAMGGTVFIMPRFDAEEALSLIAREGITTTFLVPTMLNRIVNLPADILGRYDVSSIKSIFTGASPCPFDLKQKVIAHFGAHCLHESYGSTEVGLVARILPHQHLERPGSCGQLLAGVTCRIVDGQDADVPVGEVGEILVKTPRMIERYLNEGPPKELRADGFFATGDIGRFDADGFLYILDRKKDMVICGGINVYPAEIESALREHPAVLDAAAFGVPDGDRGEVVRAAVECIPGQSVDAEVLRGFVGERLASYKRPQAIDVLAELPRNAAGKIIKRQLKAPHWQGVDKAI